MRRTDNSSAIGRYARLLRRGAIAAGAFYLAATVAALGAWSGWGGRAIAATLESGGLPLGWAAGLAVLLAVLAGAAMWQLAQMLALVGNGEVFSPGVIGRFRSFCLFFLLMLLARSLLPAIVALLLAIQAGAGPARLAFDAADIVTLVIAGLLYLVARLLEQAARWEDDSRSIV